jgi:hypothetical protein
MILRQLQPALKFPDLARPIAALAIGFWEGAGGLAAPYIPQFWGTVRVHTPNAGVPVVLCFVHL